MDVPGLAHLQVIFPINASSEVLLNDEEWSFPSNLATAAMNILNLLPVDTTNFLYLKDDKAKDLSKFINLFYKPLPTVN